MATKNPFAGLDNLDVVPPARGHNPQTLFDAALEAEGVTGHAADVMRSLYQQESGSGRNTRTSNAGARGGMQIIPTTFRSVADPDWDIDDPMDNARAGIRYGMQGYRAAGGDPALTGAFYYGGPGGMSKARAGIAVSDPRNPNAPNTLQYGAQIAARLGGSRGGPFAGLAEDVSQGYEAAGGDLGAVGVSPFAGLADAVRMPEAPPRVEPAPEAPAAPAKRTWGEAASDTLKGMAGMVNSTLGAPFALADPAGDVAQFFASNSKYWNDKLSEPLKAAQKRSEQAAQKAEQDAGGGWAGVGASLMETFKQAWQDPMLAGHVATSTIVTMIPGLGAIKAVQLAGGGARAALTAAAMTNGLINGGQSREEAFGEVKDAAMKAGNSEAEAIKIAEDGSRLAGGVGAAAGAVFGPMGTEAVIAGKMAVRSVGLSLAKRGMADVLEHATTTSARKALGRGASVTAKEVASELPEEVLPKIATNVALQPIDGTDLLAGAGSTAANTMFGAGPFGAYGGVRHARTEGSKARALKAVLDDPTAPEDVKARAWDEIAAEAKRQGVKPGEIDQWLDQQFVAADERQADIDADARQARVGQAVSETLDGYDAREAADEAMSNPPARPGYEQDWEQMLSEETGSTLQDEHGLETPETQFDRLLRETGTTREEQVGVQAAQEAAPPTPPAPAPAAPLTPAQQVAQHEAERNKRARTEFGIHKTGALATFAELDDALVDGLIDEDQFNVAAGLLAGDAVRLAEVRSMLAELKNLAQIAQAEAAKPEPMKDGTPPDVESIVADLDPGAVQIEEPAPKPEQKPEVKVEPVAAPAPAGEMQVNEGETPGQAMVRHIDESTKKKNKAAGKARVRGMSKEAKTYAMLALGYNADGSMPANGPPRPGERTHELIAQMAGAHLGKPVNGKSVQKVLNDYGLPAKAVKTAVQNEGAVDRTASMNTQQPVEGEGATAAAPLDSAEGDAPRGRKPVIEQATEDSTAAVDAAIAQRNAQEAGDLPEGVTPALAKALNHNKAAMAAVPEAREMWGQASDVPFESLTLPEQARYVMAANALNAENERKGATDNSRLKAWARFTDVENKLLKKYDTYSEIEVDPATLDQADPKPVGEADTVEMAPKIGTLDLENDGWSDTGPLQEAAREKQGVIARMVSKFKALRGAIKAYEVEGFGVFSPVALKTLSAEQQRAVSAAFAAVTEHPVLGPTAIRALRALKAVGAFHPTVDQRTVMGGFIPERNAVDLNVPAVIDPAAASANNMDAAGKLATVVGHELVAHAADWQAGEAIGHNDFATTVPGGPLTARVTRNPDGSISIKYGPVLAELMRLHAKGALPGLENAVGKLARFHDEVKSGLPLTATDFARGAAAAEEAAIEGWGRIIEAMGIDAARLKEIAPRSHALAEAALKAKTALAMGRILSGQPNAGAKNGNQGQANPGAVPRIGGQVAPSQQDVGRAGAGREVERPGGTTGDRDGAQGVPPGAAQNDREARVGAAGVDAAQRENPSGAEGAADGRGATQGGRAETGLGVTRHYARQGTPAQAAQQANTSLSGALQWAKDAKDWSFQRVAYTTDLVASAKKYLPSAQKYLDLARRAQADRAKSELDITSIVSDFYRLKSSERGTGPGTVNGFLKDSTLEKKWGFKPSWQPGAQVDPAMEAKFKALSPQAQAVVRRVLQHGHDSIVQLRRAALDSIAHESDALIKAARDRGDLEGARKAENAKLRSVRAFTSLAELDTKMPYAPLKRFGNEVVIYRSNELAAQEAIVADETASDGAKTAARKKIAEMRQDAKHYGVWFRESRSAARKLAEQVRRETGGRGEVEQFAREAPQYGSMGDMMTAFHRLREMVDNSTDKDLREKSSGALRQLMADLHLSLLSEQSVRQSGRRREGVLGADEDMMRAFESHGRALANFTASLHNTREIQQQISNMRKEARDNKNPGTTEERQDYFNELLRRHMMNMDYQPPSGWSTFASKTMAGTSAWMLLTSISYHVSNATQPWAMSLPLMAAKHGYGRASAALIQAYRDVAPALSDGRISKSDFSKLPADVRDVVTKLADEGVIMISLETEMGRWAQTDNPTLAGASRTAAKVTHTMTKLAQTTEAVNRLATAVAAVRLEQQRGSDGFDFARQIIDQSHGEYAGWNAPRFMRGPTMRMVTQFRKFQLIQASLWVRLAHDSFKGASAQERKVARYALAYSLAHMGALGGLVGMPAFSLIAFLLNSVMGGGDEPWDTEDEVAKMFGDGVLGRLMARGAPFAFMNTDMSGRWGAGQAFSMLPFTDLKATRDGWSSVVTSALGPFVGGVAPRAVEGLGLMKDGQVWKGMEGLMPKGVADFSKAIRQETQGVTNKRGDVLITPEEMNVMDDILQGIGFPTATTTERGRNAGVKFKVEEFYKARADKLKREFMAARKAGDQAAMAEVRKAWMNTQAARRSLGLQAQPMSQLVQAAAQQQKRERNTVGGIQYNKSNRRFVESLVNRGGQDDALADEGDGDDED